jgi:hypothetical protein
MKLLTDSLCSPARRNPCEIHTEQPAFGRSSGFSDWLFDQPPSQSERFNNYALQLSRGHGDFPDLHATMPYILVNRAREKDYREGTDDRRHTRIYFHNRETWKQAYHYARMALSHGLPVVHRAIRLIGATAGITNEGVTELYPRR